MQISQIKELLNTDTSYQELKDNLDLNAIDCIYKAEQANELDVNLEKFRDDAGEYIQQSCDIIYYHKAMEYLMDNDPSLTTSLELAHDMGYETYRINSELLANILFQNELQTLLSNFILELESTVE